AFFEWKGGGTFCKPAGWRVGQALQVDHLSFSLPDHESLLALQARLQEAEVEVTEEIDHGFIHSIYFTDPNGIALEASFWLLDPTGRPVDYNDERMCSAADPLRAVRECGDRGRLDRPVPTHRVDEVTRDFYKPV